MADAANAFINAEKDFSGSAWSQAEQEKYFSELPIHFSGPTNLFSGLINLLPKPTKTPEAMGTNLEGGAPATLGGSAITEEVIVSG